MDFKNYDKYKDSGMEWFSEMPEDWNLFRLKDIASIRFSNVDKKSDEEQQQVFLCNYIDVYRNDFITSSLDFLQATASKDEIKKFALRRTDVVITRDSESFEDIAKPALVIDELKNVICGYHLAIIRTKNGLDGAFLFRLLQAANYNYLFSINAKGITRVGLGMNSISDSSFFIPKFHIQTAIAEYLNERVARIDASIKLLQAKREKFQELRKTLISEAITKGLDKTIEIEDSGVEWLGEIPKHWEVKRVKDLFKLITDVAPNNNAYQLLSIYTSIGVKPRAELEQRGNKAVTTDGYWIVRKGDFIVNKLLAWMGAIALSDYDGVTSPAYDILRKKIPLVQKYYEYLFRIEAAQAEFKRHSRGIMDVRLRLYFDKFGAISVPVPRLEEQQQIVDYLNEKTEKIDVIISTIDKNIETLNEFRKTLINDVVTGKIKVV